MELRILPAVIKCLFIAVLITGCDSSDDNPSNPDNPTKENTIAKYSLTFRGQTSSWTDENSADARFQLQQVPLKNEEYFSLGIAMLHESASSSQSHGVTFTGLVADKNITSGTISPQTYSLVHIHTYDEEKDCFDNPGGCVGFGMSLVQGTEPSSDSGAVLSGVDNNIHAQSGSITITSLTITENNGTVIEGLVSGHFSLSGINTNASKPNPGTASGSFENAPFSTLAFQ